MDKIFITVCNMSLTGAFVIAAICLARLPLKKAPKVFSYFLWAVAGFRLLVPFSIESVFSLLPFNTDPIPTDIAVQAAPRIDSGITVLDGFVNATLPEAAGGGSTIVDGVASAPLFAQMTAAAWVWAVGLIAMLVFGIVSYVRLKQKMDLAVRVSGQVFESDAVRSPFMLGLFNPRIYLPLNLSEEESEYVIAHEQMHLRRHDHIVRFVAYFILSMHWFNPLVWLAFILMETDMELSCDERVIRELGDEARSSYSLSLLALSTDRRLFGSSLLAFSEGGLKERIKRIMSTRKPSRAIVLLALAFVVVLSMGFAMNRVIMTDQPVNTPELIITADGVEIDSWLYYGSSQSKDDISRADAFRQIMSSSQPADLCYVPDNETITIAVDSSTPSSVTIHEYAIDAEGEIIPGLLGGSCYYNSNDYLHNLYAFVIPYSMEVSQSMGARANIGGYIIRGYHITFKWGGKTLEYAFVVRGTAARVITSYDPRDNFPTNESGQTYGVEIYVTDENRPITPDLIRALASNGETGYVYSVDINTRSNYQPTSPEDALTVNDARKMSPAEAFVFLSNARLG